MILFQDFDPCVKCRRRATGKSGGEIGLNGLKHCGNGGEARVEADDDEVFVKTNGKPKEISNGTSKEDPVSASPSDDNKQQAELCCLTPIGPNDGEHVRVKVEEEAL